MKHTELETKAMWMIIKLLDVIEVDSPEYYSSSNLVAEADDLLKELES